MSDINNINNISTLDGHTATIVQIPTKGKYVELRYQIGQLRDQEAILLDVNPKEVFCIRQMLLKVFGKGYVSTKRTDEGLLIWKAKQ